jgi:opacity protein-like surface antigen
MKTYRIVSTAFFVLFMATGLNAQVFVGGNFGINLSGGKHDNGTTVTDRPSNLGINLSPRIGTFLSEKVAAGISLSLGYSRHEDNIDGENIGTTSTFGVSPFMRYYAIQAGKFSVFGQGSLGFYYSSEKSKIAGTTNEGPKSTQLSLDFFPGVAYDLTEKISLETSISLLNMGLTLQTTKEGNNKTTGTNFNLGGGLNNLASIGNITIGAIYKF